MSVFVCASTSSDPNRTELVGGSDSEELKEEEEDSSKRLYSTGVYLSKLDPSLLGGGLLDLNVRAWMGDIR